MGRFGAVSDRDVDLDGTTNAGLVALLLAAQQDDWDGEAARLLGQVVEQKVGKNLRWLFARQRDLSPEHARGVVISQTWQVLRLQTAAVLQAGDPWGYVAILVSRQLATAVAGSAHEVAVPTDPEELTSIPGEPLTTATIDPLDILESGAMVRLVRELVALGAPRDATWKILRRCTQICAERGFTKRHSVARRDWYLEQHGLSPDQASNWMNLVTGSRRSGEHESALWRLSHGLDFSRQNRRWAIAAVHRQPELSTNQVA